MSAFAGRPRAVFLGRARMKGGEVTPYSTPLENLESVHGDF